MVRRIRGGARLGPFGDTQGGSGTLVGGAVSNGGASVSDWQAAGLQCQGVLPGHLAAGHALLTVNYQITGGTGRFEGASGVLNYTAAMRAVLRNASNAPALLALTGEIEGTISGQP